MITTISTVITWRPKLRNQTRFWTNSPRGTQSQLAALPETTRLGSTNIGLRTGVATLTSLANILSAGKNTLPGGEGV